MTGIVTRLPASLCCLTGALLIPLAWPIANTIPNDALYFAYVAIMVVVCIAASIATIHFYQKHSKPAFHVMAALSCVVLFTFTQSDRQSMLFAISQLVTLSGVILLCIGMYRLPEFRKYNAAIAWLLLRINACPAVLFLAILGIFFLSATLALGWYCHQFMPLIWDSVAQFIHAKIMAEGMLYAPSHPLKEFFDTEMMINDGKWYSQYQPAQIFLLSLGQRVSAPWLINPLAGAATMVATYQLAKLIYGEKVAKLASLLFCCSPFILFISSEYMSHANALLFATLMLWAYLKGIGEENPKILCSLWAGIFLGVLFLIRPLTAVGMGLPCVAHSLYAFFRGKRSRTQICLLFVGPAVALVIQGWYNLQLTGSIWIFPYAKSDTLFAGITEVGSSLNKAAYEWGKMNVMLLGWFFPSTLIAALGWIFCNRSQGSWLLPAVIISMTAVNMANRFDGILFGPRYLYEITVPLIILISACIVQLPSIMGSIITTVQADKIRRISIAVFAMLFIGSLPLLADNLKQYSQHYIRRDFNELVRQAKSPALVFIELSSPYKDVNYTRVAFTNPPQDSAPIIFVRDLGMQKNRELMRYYPHRTAYQEHDGKLTMVGRGK